MKGPCLVHSNLRRDTIILTPDDRVIFIDWSWLCQGAHWLDIVCFAFR